MRRINWKQQQPTNMRRAIELCIKYAQLKKNLSVERIADRMGLESHWTLYKWCENGRMPAIMIRPFELATGCHYVTQYIATSAHKLLVDIPRGVPANQDEVLELQAAFNQSMLLLNRFYKGDEDAKDTIAALNDVMARVAGHRENVQQSAQPELDLFGGAE